MYIENTYKYEINGVIYVGANVPQDATILEAMDILVAEDGYDLIRLSDGENVGSSIWLHDGDTVNNYTEAVRPEE